MPGQIMFNHLMPKYGSPPITLREYLGDRVEFWNNCKDLCIPSNKYTLLDVKKYKTNESNHTVCCGKIQRFDRFSNPSKKNLDDYRDWIYNLDGCIHTFMRRRTSGYYVFDPLHNSGQGIVRNLAVQELYAIMGYPTTFKYHDKITKATGQLGNSVSPPMISYLITFIEPIIKKITTCNTDQ
jgi:site-specific DNA-cytosine methylase